MARRQRRADGDDLGGLCGGAVRPAGSARCGVRAVPRVTENPRPQGPPGIESGPWEDHDCSVDITLAELPAPRPDADAVVDRAVARAARWMTAAEGQRTFREKANRRRLTRLLRDPCGTARDHGPHRDQVMRISDSGRAAAATLRSAAAESNRRALGLRDHVGLLAVSRWSTLAWNRR